MLLVYHFTSVEIGETLWWKLSSGEDANFLLANFVSWDGRAVIILEVTHRFAIRAAQQPGFLRQKSNRLKIEALIFHAYVY